MPTVLRVGPYRFFFYAGDGTEPAHIHVSRENHTAKFWLNPIRLQSSGRFGRQEIKRIQKIVEENQDVFLGEWDEFFSE